MAKDRGIDLDREIDPVEMEQEIKLRDRINKHICFILADKYTKMSREWLHGKGAEISGEDELIKIPGVVSLGSDPDLLEAKQVVGWYQYLIHAKIARALLGKAEADGIDPDDNSSDSDGSAKVALIGIDRSMAAWGVLLRGTAKGGSSEIQEILFCLERLRRKMENCFPNVRAFVRPGFDDV